MPTSSAGIAMWSLAALQALGLVIACLTRVTVGSNLQSVCERLFFCTLVLLAAGSMAAVMISQAHFVFCASTVAVMALAATWDVKSATARE